MRSMSHAARATPTRGSGPIAALLLVPSLLATVGCSSDATTKASSSVDASTTDAGAAPPHPFLADSPWPISHQSPYAQGSSPLPGPDAAATPAVEHLPTDVASITLAFSAQYPDGGRVIWGSSAVSVFKVDPAPDGLKLIAKHDKQQGLDSLIAGAYTLIAADGTFYATESGHIDRYADEIAGDRLSGIVRLGRFSLPAPSKDEVVIGLSITWDGTLVYATSHGRVGALTRDLAPIDQITLGADERVSNSIAVDEAGGIYVVTSASMRRVQWTGTQLSTDPADGAWVAPYRTGPATPFPGRLGIGSGSTPSLMGSGTDDRLVVITDGEQLMNLVFFWRDAIPAGWTPIRPGADPRIAAEVPITFGKTDATSSISEQSVLIDGYRAVVVNNDYGPVGTAMQPILAGVAPPGIEQFAWDPTTRTATRTWVVPDVSCPNGIPTMSRADSTFFCIGKRGADWTLEALDWTTGAHRFTRTLGPGLSYNSTYAATEVGPDGAIYSGTFNGLVRVR